MLTSGQIINHPVRVLRQGPADGLRGEQKSLPTRGTWGIVAFIYGDVRNGIWLGSYDAVLIDSITTSDGEPFTEYSSHWSGAYEILTDNGEWCKSFPDGTYVLCTADNAKPATYRHIVNPDQTVSQISVSDAARTPNPPASRYYTIHTASGTEISVDPSGNLSGTVAGNLTVNVSGTTTVVSSGAASVTAPSVEVISSTGSAASITLGGSGQTLQELVTATFVSLFNGHNHTINNVAAGTGSITSTAPNQTMGSSELTSTVQAS